QHRGWVSSGWRLYRPHPQGRKTRGFASRAGEQIRAGHQCTDRPHARPRNSGQAARCCRCGDRVMRRREFITLLGGAATWPLAARAQQPSKTSKVGILYPGMAAALPSRVAGFRDGLRAAGYRETDNIELLSRAADGDPTRITRLAMELAERKVDV